MKYDIEKINALDVVEVARKLGLEVKKRGSTLVCNCPWHSDNMPSMQLWTKRQMMHCFVCNETHNNIGAAMKTLGKDFKEACEWFVEMFPNEGLLIETDGEKKPQNSLKKLEALVRKTNTRSNDEPFMVFDYDFLNDRLTLENSFCRCMVEVFGAERAVAVMRDYWLGSLEAHGRYPDVIFPLIDRRGLLRDMKVQTYDCDTRSDRFFHNTGLCYWYGGMHFKEATFNRQCLFGEHLLARHPDRVVVLVESPKNACVGAAAYPQYLWVATGNKGMLKRSVLEVLQGRMVVVFPDEDAYDEWAEKLEGMKDIACFTVQRAPALNKKSDIADFIIEQVISKR